MVRSMCVCAFAARSVKASGIGRLLVTILEATELKAGKPNGEREYFNVAGCTWSFIGEKLKILSCCV